MTGFYYIKDASNKFLRSQKDCTCPICDYFLLHHKTCKILHEGYILCNLVHAIDPLIT